MRLDQTAEVLERGSTIVDFSSDEANIDPSQNEDLLLLLGMDARSEAEDQDHDVEPSDLDEIDAEAIQRLIEFFLILKRWEAKAKGPISPDEREHSAPV